MPYKIMMSVAAIVPLLFLIAFLVVPQFFILESYPNAEGLALEIGILSDTLWRVCYSSFCVLYINPETLRK